MLLIEGFYRSLTSVNAKYALTPLFFHRSQGSLEDARDFLRRFRSDDSFQHVLRKELACSFGTPFPSMNESRLVDEVAQRIAARTIQVASPLRKKLTILFDEQRPQGEPFGAVGFSSLSVARAFVETLRYNQGASAAVGRALGHDIGRQWMRVVSASSTVPPAFLAPTRGGEDLKRLDGDWNPAQVATLFADGCLMLLPFMALPLGFCEGAFRLLWRRTWGAGGVFEEMVVSPSLPIQPEPARNRRIDHPVGPRSVLPKAPEILSLQADALLEAARLAYPFCEECAKYAAASAKEATHA